VTWNGKEDLKITNTDKVAETITEIVMRSPFKTKVIPETIFVKFPNLKSLVILQVGLESISVHDFVDANKLTNLHIIRNNIPTLASNTFKNAENLMMIDLSENQITKIEEDAFNGLNFLTKLNLYSNKLANLDLSMFTKLPKLEYLNVANNDFKFPERFSADEAAKLIELNSTITTLDLSNNPIDSPDLWKRLSIFPNLEIVHITANKITHVDFMDEFKQLLPHVTTLTMDENPFEPKWLEKAKIFFEKEKINFRYD